MDGSRLNVGRRGYALVRSLILAISTLAIVGVLFAVYQSATGVPELASIVQDPGGGAVPALREDEPPGVSAGGAASLGPGGVIRLGQYDPGSSKVRRELEVTSWRPIGDAHGDMRRIEVTNTVIRDVLPDGQLMRIRAETGSLDVTKDFDPRSGALSGHVTIEIDRRTEEQRTRLSPAQRDAEPDAANMIRLDFESLTFDAVTARLETDGPFTVRMAEAEVNGRGLRIAYNEVDDRLEHFEMVDGGSMVLHGAGALFNKLIPGGPPTPAPMNRATVAETTPDSAADTEVQGATNGNAVAPVAAAQLQAYRVDIDKDVSIRGFEGQTVVQRLTADALSILYDFDLRKRDDARSGRSSLPGSDGDARSGARDPAGAADARLVVSWSGRFLIQPHDDERPGTDAPRIPRLHMTATGQEVRFADRSGEAVCRLLIVYRDARQAQLEGSDDRPVVLTLPGHGRLTAPAVDFDRKNGFVLVRGPARLTGDLPHDAQRRRRGGGYDLRFQRSAELTIGTHTVSRVDPVSGVSRISDIDYIQSATLRGEVLFKQEDGVFAGDHVVMEFDPPRASGTARGDLRSITADGHVLQVRGQDRLTADHLHVDFVADPTGRALPRRARARGDVVITQGELMVAAQDEMTMDLIPVIKSKPAFDALGARADAVLRGEDPETIDWDRVRTEYESKVEYTANPNRIEAHGDVRAYDASRRLDLSADSVVTEFTNGRRIARARITGQAGRDAFIQLGDMTISAHRIDADPEAERADVFGAGKLSFVTHRGLDGAWSETPQDVEMSWTGEMAYRGARNSARCVGQVHAVSRRRLPPEHAPSANTESGTSFGVLETVGINAEELVIDFVDKETVEEPSVDERWWILAPLAKRWGRTNAEPAVRFDKEPVYFIASRDVVAVFSNVEMETIRLKNRVTLASQKLTADLRTDLLTVPAAGTLLIEDYKQPQATRPAAGGLFDQWEGDAPSQTYVSWGGSLTTFHAGSYRADFRDDVRLVHRSGEAIAFPKEMLHHQAFAPVSTGGTQTRLDCGALMVEFAKRSGAAPRQDAGLGGMSVRALRQLDATGGVILTADDFTVDARRIVKYENSELLRIFGSEDAEAEIYSDRPDGPRFRGPEFNFNLRSGAIDAPHPQFRMRGRR